MTIKEKFKSRKFISLLLMCVAFYAVLITFLVGVFVLSSDNRVSILKDYLVFMTPTYFATILAYGTFNVVQKKILRDGGKNRK